MKDEKKIEVECSQAMIFQGIVNAIKIKVSDDMINNVNAEDVIDIAENIIDEAIKNLNESMRTKKDKIILISLLIANTDLDKLCDIDKAIIEKRKEISGQKKIIKSIKSKMNIH